MKDLYPHPIIAREGWPFIIGGLLNGARNVIRRGIAWFRLVARHDFPRNTNKGNVRSRLGDDIGCCCSAFELTK